jgi:cytochrome P450
MMGFGAELQRSYGDVVHFRLGPFSAYQFTHPDHIAEILIRQAKKFRKPVRLKQVFGRFEGNGLIVSDGPFWSRQRRLVQPAFATARILSYAPMIRQIADGLSDAWNGRDSVELYEEMMGFTLRILSRTLFSTQGDEEVNRISEAVRIYHRWSIDQLNRVIPTPRWWPLWFQPDVRRALGTLHTLVGDWIARRRAMTQQPDDLLGMLLAATDTEGDGRGMSDRSLRDELVTLLLGGQESTAAALTWAGWLLAIHPEIQERCASAAVLPESSFPIYIEQVFKESMRLYPAIYSISREASEPADIAGYRLMPGSLVFLSPYLTQRDPRWFPEPETFDPERFSPEREAALPSCAWFPFGAGPRGCVGRGLALLEGTLILGSLLRRYRLEPRAGQGDPEKEWQLSLRPKGGLRLRLRQR